MIKRYDVQLVVYDRAGNEMLVSISVDGNTSREAIDNAIADARTMLKDGVMIEANGYRCLDE